MGCGGLFLSLAEMIKLGQLYLAQGRWKGQQILDPVWVAEAAKKHIDTPSLPGVDAWSCGYGYQFWLAPYPDAFRADGAYGQVTLVLPKSGLVVAVQSPEIGNFAIVRGTLHDIVLSKL